MKCFPSIAAILLAGGRGSRIGEKTPKQYLTLRSRPLIYYSLETLLSIKEISQLIIVCDPSFKNLFNTHTCTHLSFALPGKRRQDSVVNGFKKVLKSIEWVLIHDGARPLVCPKDIRKVMRGAFENGAATLGTPLKFSVKEVDKNLMIKKTLNRDFIYNIQTPQVLRKDLLEKGIKKASIKSLTLVDDVALAELIGHQVKLVIGSETNLKITTPLDFKIAEELIDATL